MQEKNTTGEKSAYAQAQIYMFFNDFAHKLTHIIYVRFSFMDQNYLNAHSPDHYEPLFIKINSEIRYLLILRLSGITEF